MYFLSLPDGKVVESDGLEASSLAFQPDAAEVGPQATQVRIFRKKLTFMFVITTLASIADS